MKHVFGVFGLVGASSRSMTSALRKTSIVLYVGGIAVSVFVWEELARSAAIERRCAGLEQAALAGLRKSGVVDDWHARLTLQSPLKLARFGWI